MHLLLYHCCCWWLLATVCLAVTCTLAPSGGDFSTLQSAINGCRASGDLNVLIQISNGSYPCAGLVFPTDVQNITLQGVVGNYSLVQLQGTSWSVDPFFWYPAIELRWLTLDLGGTNLTLFDPPLKNNNVTMDHVVFRSSFAAYQIEQESCVDNTTFRFTNSVFYQVDGGAFKLQGIHNIYMFNNTYMFSGTNVSQAFL